MQNYINPTTSTINSSRSSGSSSTTNGRNSTYLRELLMIYEDSIGRRAPAYVREIMQLMLEDGVHPRVIEYALHQTAMAPYPSWRYAQAIIRRCRADGIGIGEMTARELSMLSGGSTGRPGRDPDLPY